MDKLFISEKDLKESSVLHENMDMKLVEPVIRDCQKLYIKRILGTALYQKLQDEINAATLAGNYKTLMDDYVQPALTRWVMYEIPTYLSYKFMNKNILKQAGQNAEKADPEEMKRLMDFLKVRAEEESENVTKYLLANTTLFPEYLNAGSSVDTIHPNKNNFTGGIFMEDANDYKNLGIKKVYDEDNRDCFD